MTCASRAMKCRNTLLEVLQKQTWKKCHVLAALIRDKRQNWRLAEVAVWHLNPTSVYQPLQIYNYKWELHISLALFQRDVLLNSDRCWCIKCASFVHTESVGIFCHWKHGLAGLIISLWGEKKRVKHWVRVEAGSREESCVISVPWLSAKGFFVPLVTMQDKHRKGCDSLDSVEFQHWEWHLGTHTSLAAELHTGPWRCSNPHLLQSWNTFLLLPSALGITVASQMEQNTPRFTIPPKKRSPPLFVCP